MYPIKTDKQKIITHYTEKEVEDFFQKRIQKKKMIQVTYDNELYGKVEAKYAKLELGQNPTRNAFRPIIILTWNKVENGTEIESYLRPDKRIVLTFAMLIPFGLYLSIEQRTFIQFISVSIIEFILIFGVMRVFYNRSKESTKEKLSDLFAGIK